MLLSSVRNFIFFLGVYSFSSAFEGIAARISYRYWVITVQKGLLEGLAVCNSPMSPWIKWAVISHAKVVVMFMIRSLL